MKKLRITLSSAIVILAIVAFNSCGDETKEPYNSITDSSGLSIELDWTTRSNTASALIESDLDLDIYKGEEQVLSSYNTDEFERVSLTDLFTDGEYTVKVNSYEILKSSDFTLNVRGIAKGKTFKMSGMFDVGEAQSPVSILKITRVGDRFIMTTL